MRVLVVGSAAERAACATGSTARSTSPASSRRWRRRARPTWTPTRFCSPAPPHHDDEEALNEPLTPREVQVVELLAEGLPNKAIAARLGISDQTVKFHLASISSKLGAANRTDAVRRAVRRGLITL
jgi:DNA-binding NarL/FixJ family response regulator